MHTIYRKTLKKAHLVLRPKVSQICASPHHNFTKVPPVDINQKYMSVSEINFDPVFILVSK